PPTTGASRVVVAGEAQATTHTSSTSAHARGRATLFERVRPPTPSFVGDLRARCLAIACLPYRLPRRPLHRVPRRALPPGARRARGRMLHAGRVEGRTPAALVVLMSATGE